MHDREEGGVKEEEMPVGVMTSFNTERVTWHLPWSCAKVDAQGGAWGDGQQTRHWAALSAVSPADTAPEEVPVSTCTLSPGETSQEGLCQGQAQVAGPGGFKKQKNRSKYIVRSQALCLCCMWRCACVSSHRDRDAGSE